MTSAYYVLEINLGIANGVLNRDEEAREHFFRAIALAPGDAIPHYFLARWLLQKGLIADAMEHLRTALELNPDYYQAQILLDEAIARSGNVTDPSK